MIWQVANFSGVEVLTYCILSTHFHVLVRVVDGELVSDAELMRRYRTLYPKPTKYQTQSTKVMESQLAAGGEEADAIRRKLLARMADVSEFMKTVKQRFRFGIIVRISAMARCGRSSLNRYWLKGKAIRCKRWLLTLI